MAGSKQKNISILDVDITHGSPKQIAWAKKIQAQSQLRKVIKNKLSANADVKAKLDVDFAKQSLNEYRAKWNEATGELKRAATTDAAAKKALNRLNIIAKDASFWIDHGRNPNNAVGVVNSLYLKYAGEPVGGREKQLLSQLERLGPPQSAVKNNAKTTSQPLHAVNTLKNQGEAALRKELAGKTPAELRKIASRSGLKLSGAGGRSKDAARVANAVVEAAKTYKAQRQAMTGTVTTAKATSQPIANPAARNEALAAAHRNIDAGTGTATQKAKMKAYAAQSLGVKVVSAKGPAGFSDAAREARAKQQAASAKPKAEAGAKKSAAKTKAPTNAQLRAQLREKGLKVSGNKSILMARLEKGSNAAANPASKVAAKPTGGRSASIIGPSNLSQNGALERLSRLSRAEVSKVAQQLKVSAGAGGKSASKKALIDSIRELARYRSYQASVFADIKNAPDALIGSNTKVYDHKQHGALQKKKTATKLHQAMNTVVSTDKRVNVHALQNEINDFERKMKAGEQKRIDGQKARRTKAPAKPTGGPRGFANADVQAAAQEARAKNAKPPEAKKPSRKSAPMDPLKVRETASKLTGLMQNNAGFDAEVAKLEASKHKVKDLKAIGDKFLGYKSKHRTKAAIIKSIKTRQLQDAIGASMDKRIRKIAVSGLGGFAPYVEGPNSAKHSINVNKLEKTSAGKLLKKPGFNGYLIGGIAAHAFVSAKNRGASTGEALKDTALVAAPAVAIAQSGKIAAHTGARGTMAINYALSGKAAKPAANLAAGVALKGISVSAKIVSRVATPALLGYAVYQGVKSGYKRGGVKTAAVDAGYNVADFVTFGAVSGFQSASAAGKKFAVSQGKTAGAILDETAKKTNSASESLNNKKLTAAEQLAAMQSGRNAAFPGQKSGAYLNAGAQKKAATPTQRRAVVNRPRRPAVAQSTNGKTSYTTLKGKTVQATKAQAARWRKQRKG